MKVFLSSDMEGTAGVVDWEQCVGDGPEAAAGRQLLLDEVNAAHRGSAGRRRDRDRAQRLALQHAQSAARRAGRQASYISGSHKPLYMMQGLDGSFDAVLFISYHGSVGRSGRAVAHL